MDWLNKIKGVNTSQASKNRRQLSISLEISEKLVNNVPLFVRSSSSGASQAGQEKEAKSM